MSMDATVFRPEDHPQAASDFLALQPARVRQWIIPHVAERDRGHVMDRAFQCASHACIVYAGDAPAAFGWLVPVSPMARSAWAHFILPPMPRDMLLSCATELTREGLRFYDGLCCLVPRPLYGVGRILEALNFQKLATLPGACRIETRNRCVDGILYSRTVKNA